jgi:hypothetical protein
MELRAAVHNAGLAGGLGLEPRLHGSKGRRAADYPIPHHRFRRREIRRPTVSLERRAAVHRTHLPVAARTGSLAQRWNRATVDDGGVDTAGPADDVRPRPGGVRVRMTGAQRRRQLLDVGRELFAQRG